MKVLIISYDFFPDTSPNAYRWYHVAQYWSKKGVEVFVIAAHKSRYNKYQEIDGIKIFRTGEYFVGNLKYSFNKEVAELAKNDVSGSLSPKRTLTTILKKVYNYTWSKIYWPDYAFLWKFQAYKIASKLIGENKIDRIVSVSWMFTGHLVALKLKKKIKNLIWLADTIDPFSLNEAINNKFFYSKFNRRIEKKVLLNADVNSVLTENIKEEFITKYQIPRQSIIVNKNVFLPEEIPDELQQIESIDNTKNLVFLGTLSEHTRSPNNLLLLIENLVKTSKKVDLRIDVFGDCSGSIHVFNKFPNLLNKVIFLNGLVAKNKISKILNQADVLINIGNSNPYQEPSKVIEYMYSGKPILNICSIDNDTSAKLLEKYPIHLNVFPKDIDSSLFLEKLEIFLTNTTLVDQKEINFLLKEHFLDYVAEKYYKSIFEI